MLVSERKSPVCAAFLTRFAGIKSWSVALRRSGVGSFC